MKGKALLVGAVAAVAIGISTIAGASAIDVRVPDWSSADTDGPSADWRTSAAAPNSARGADMGFAFASVQASIPELPVWTMLLLGFAGVGIGMRRQRAKAPRSLADDDI